MHKVSIIVLGALVAFGCSAVSCAQTADQPMARIERTFKVIFDDHFTIHRTIVQYSDGTEEAWQAIACHNATITSSLYVPVGAILSCPPNTEPLSYW